jgi:hypothetical protein
MSSKLASLHAGLIARKGEAAPAVAHPAYSYVDGPRPAPQPMRRDGDGIEWRSFGAPAALPSADAPEPVPALVRATPPTPPAPEPVRAVPPQKPAADDHAGPYRLTFRMTADQRRRLRIAAAKEEMSLQELLSNALDSHLDTLCACKLHECTCLAREGGQHEAH